MPRPRGLLQGYYFDAKARRYMRAGKPGFVARSKVVRLMERSVREREQRLYVGARRFVDGEISPATWLSRTTTMLKRQHLQNAALGAGGWDRLGPEEWGRVGGMLGADYTRLANMAEQIAAGEVSVPQALNRMQMYMGRARAEFYTVERDGLPDPGYGKVRMERRALGAAEHCEDCLRFAAMGWQIEGTLPVPGMESRCDGNCRCELKYKIVDAQDSFAWIGRAAKGGPALATKGT